MSDWFRTPLNFAKTLDGAAKATREQAGTDLLGRWHMGGNPGPRELMKAWSWSADRVGKLAREMRAWAIGAGGRVPAVDLYARPYKIGQAPDIDRTPIVHANVVTTPEVVESPDIARTDIGQAPNLSCERVRTPEERAETKEEDHLSAPADPPVNEPLALAVVPKPKPDPEQDLYDVWRACHPRCRALTPTPANRKALRAILVECGSPDAAGVYVAWAHQSQDAHARQLRGEDPWLDGKLTERSDLVSLSRNIPPRLSQAEAWEARGRTGPAPAMMVTTGAAVTAWSALAGKAWVHLEHLEHLGHHRSNVPPHFSTDAALDMVFRRALAEAGGWAAFCGRDRFTTKQITTDFCMAFDRFHKPMAAK